MEKAEGDLALAQRARAARDGADRRRELSDRIEQAEAARSAMETAAAARIGPDAETLRRLERLATAHATAVAARDATATQVIARYDAGRDGAIRDGDRPLVDGQPVPLPRATRLTIEGVGQLEVRPGEAAHDDRSVEAAVEKLHKALAEAGAETLDAARAAAAERAEAERRHGEARAVLDSLAPEGIDRLREALARIPVLDETTEAPDPEAAEAALARAREAFDKARAEREAILEGLSDARDAAARSDATLAELRVRLKRAQEGLEKFADASEDRLAQEAQEAAAAVGTAEAELADKARDAPDLSTTEAALARAGSVDRQAREEIARLKPLLARLDERIGRSSGEAVEERLAEVEQELEAASARLAGIEHEVAVLQRLKAALETARNEARERYFAPIAQELKPLLQLLWPEAELTWQEDKILPSRWSVTARKSPSTSCRAARRNRSRCWCGWPSPGCWRPRDGSHR